MRLTDTISTLRLRLVLGLVAAFAAMAAFGLISYRYVQDQTRRLARLEQTTRVQAAALTLTGAGQQLLAMPGEKRRQRALTALQNLERLLTAYHAPDLAVRLRQPLSRLRQLLTRPTPNPERGPPPRRLTVALQSLAQAAGGLAQADPGVGTGGYLPLLAGFLVCLGLIGAVVLHQVTVRMVRPLAAMEEATRRVAKGDFRPIEGPVREDEIGRLVRAFNRMVVHLRQSSEQMIQTEKLSALGTLTSGVAHELNNPLNNISTSCQILQEELGPAADPYHRELLEAIEEQVDKARDIVGSLLEFARQREFTPQPEDMAEVVEEALKLIRGEIPEEVELRVSVPAGIRAEVDKAHLVQALINLVMNGIQAMEGGGVLGIRGRREGGEVVLEISDTGVGIPPEILPRIFDPFFTTKDIGHGTGLGLSITYGVVERHHGRIEVASTPGRGSRFSLRLPLRRE